jgi:hypothetical protein
MVISKTEYIRRVIEAVNSCQADEYVDDHGEIIIHTGMYVRRVDNVILDEPDPVYQVPIYTL